MTETTADTSERALLQAYLGAQRKHVLGAVDGLSDEDLLRPVLPSGWSCASMIQHLALEVERFWFRQVMAGAEIGETEHTGADGNAWALPAGTSPQSVIELYRREVGLADAIVAATSLEAQPAWWPDYFASFRMDNLRDVILHVIAETACHAGHLDAARELIDGGQWMVLAN